MRSLNFFSGQVEKPSRGTERSCERWLAGGVGKKEKESACCFAGFKIEAEVGTTRRQQRKRGQENTERGDVCKNFFHDGSNRLSQDQNTLEVRGAWPENSFCGTTAACARVGHGHN